MRKFIFTSILFGAFGLFNNDAIAQKTSFQQLTPQEQVQKLKDFLSRKESFEKEFSELEKLCEIEAESLDCSFDKGEPVKFALNYKPKGDKSLTEDQKKQIEKVIKDPLMENFLGQGGVDTEQLKKIRGIMAISPRSNSPFEPLINNIKNINNKLANNAPTDPGVLQDLNNAANQIANAINQGANPPSGAPSNGSGGGTPSGQGNSNPGNGSGSGTPGSSGGGNPNGQGTGSSGANNPRPVISDQDRDLPRRMLGQLQDGLRRRITGNAVVDSTKPSVDLGKESKDLNSYRDALLNSLSSNQRSQQPLNSGSYPQVNSNYTSGCECIQWTLVQFCQPFIVYGKHGCIFKSCYPMVIHLPVWAWVPNVMPGYNQDFRNAPSLEIKAPSMVSTIMVSPNMNSESAYLAGKSAFHEDKFADAIKYFDFTLSKDSQHSLAWHYRAVAQKKLGLEKEAVYSAKKASALFNVQNENQKSILYGLEKIQGIERQFLSGYRNLLSPVESEALAKEELPYEIKRLMVGLSQMN